MFGLSKQSIAPPKPEDSSSERFSINGIFLDHSEVVIVVKLDGDDRKLDTSHVT